jgi:NitT/TauT family transport system substrate-binding protein
MIREDQMYNQASKFRMSCASMIVAAAAMITSTAPVASQSVEKKDVTFMLDWTISGTHAPFFIPLDKGYYKEGGLNVRLDRGTGAANTAANVASGVYDFGWADIATMIGFNAQNPEKELTLVYVHFQDSPLAIVSLKKAGINKLKDLEGKIVGDQPGSASGAVIDVLTKAGTPDEIKINRKFTAPQMREPMLIKGDVDAIMAFDVSSVMTLIDLGVPKDQISILKYSDIGFDVYGTGLWVRRDFLEKNPKTIAEMVKAINKGTKDAIANPRAAAEVMKKYNQLLNVDIECERLLMGLQHDLNGEVPKYGLSHVDPKRMQSSIDQVVKAMRYPRSPALDHVWTDKFLPPAAERMPPRLGTCAAKS